MRGSANGKRKNESAKVLAHGRRRLLLLAAGLAGIHTCWGDEACAGIIRRRTVRLPLGDREKPSASDPLAE